MTKAAIRVADPALWTVFAIGFNQYMGSYIDQDLLFYGLLGTSLLNILGVYKLHKILA